MHEEAGVEAQSRIRGILRSRAASAESDAPSLEEIPTVRPTTCVELESMPAAGPSTSQVSGEPGGDMQVDSSGLGGPRVPDVQAVVEGSPVPPTLSDKMLQELMKKLELKHEAMHLSNLQFQKAFREARGLYHEISCSILKTPSPELKDDWTPETSAGGDKSPVRRATITEAPMEAKASRISVGQQAAHLNKNASAYFMSPMATDGSHADFVASPTINGASPFTSENEMNNRQRTQARGPGSLIMTYGKTHSMCSRESDRRIETQNYTQEQLRTILRLQARLGLIRSTGYISADDVLSAVRSLGLEKVGYDDMELLLRVMKEQVKWLHNPTGDENARANFSNKLRTATSMASIVSRFRHWPLRRMGGAAMLEDPHFQAVRISFKDFVEGIFTIEEWSGRSGPDIDRLAMTVREVLFSGDANRLVAELTEVRVDDLAAPRPPYDVSSIVEIILGIVIMLNGVLIGVQADGDSADWKGWYWLDLGFALFFLIEILLRWHYDGCKSFFTGSDAPWNCFDSVVVILACVDVSLHTASLFSETSVEPGASLTILRLVRLTRLTRLFKIFRLRFMKELNLMVKGLLAGLKTLLWAFVLLVFTVYLIAVFTTALYSRDHAVDKLGQDEIFSSVPNSMFTAFRCFVGDCTTTEGEPISLLMARAHGFWFICGYVASIMFVTFGIFNLIVAVYIEQTIDAAKRNEDASRRNRQRESLRIAFLTKKLLKKFCAAHRVCEKLFMVDNQEDIRKILSDCAADDVEDKGMAISREMFLTVVQDPEVQRLMDDLDIPPDRAHLFDILDADGSGVLEVTELIQGLLRVRGEAKKSDVVAAVLGVRAVQEMLRQLATSVLQQQESILVKLSPELWGARGSAGSSASSPTKDLLGSARQTIELTNSIADRALAVTSGAQLVRRSSTGALQ
mmetsp:Transcript_58202/g.138595  ORF Transcript_58202/g.138595 Transcript_58202/m.138595 type:complete len:913 (+) Transcript_58202:99-2837(+)